MPYKIICIIPHSLYHILRKNHIILKFFWIFLFFISIFFHFLKPWNLWVSKMVYYPLYFKNNTPKRNPSSHRFAYGSLVCSFISTTDAVISNFVHSCPHFLHLYILIQVLPPELFFYCEYSSRALTYTYILN